MLKRLGFVQRPRTSTSHEKWVLTADRRRFVVTVDQPKAPYARALLGSMLKQAGLSKRRFFKLLEKI